MSVNFKGMFKGALFSVAVTLIIILILALLSYFTSVSETVITAVVYASVVLGVLTGSVAVSKIAEQKAFLNVLLLCVIYLLLLVGISFAFNGAIAINAHFFALLAGVLLSGLLGLMLGK